MTEVEQLQAQIEELKKTVDDLKSGCLKVETDRQKLSRLREEIRNSVIPEEARVRISGNGYGHSRFVQNINISRINIWTKLFSVMRTQRND